MAFLHVLYQSAKVALVRHSGIKTKKQNKNKHTQHFDCVADNLISFDQRVCTALMTPLHRGSGAFRSRQLWSNMSDTLSIQSSIISRCSLRCSLMWGSLHSLLWSVISTQISRHPSQRLYGGSLWAAAGRQSCAISFFTIQGCDVQSCVILGANIAELQLLFYDVRDV